jgi:hypothetical protein
MRASTSSMSNLAPHFSQVQGHTLTLMVFTAMTGELKIGRAVTAAGTLAGPVLGPEHVDALGTLVAVRLALVGLERKRVEFLAHHLAVGDAGPRAALAVRPLAGVEGHDLRLDLGLDVGEQGCDLFALDLGQLGLHDEPRDGVEVVAEHLHAEARALDEVVPPPMKMSATFRCLRAPSFWWFL